MSVCTVDEIIEIETRENMRSLCGAEVCKYLTVFGVYGYAPKIPNPWCVRIKYLSVKCAAGY